jgi:hypothetical protein
MNHTRIFQILLVLFAVVLCFGPVSLAGPLGTAFTYQGRLIDANNAADGLYDLQFLVCVVDTNGNWPIGEVNKPGVDVIDGYFTVELDFGDIFYDYGEDLWLEIGVRPGDQNDPNVYAFLSPLQKITPTPYALYAKTAGNVFGMISGTGTSNYIPKFISYNSIGNSIIYESTGNVGIGTTIPTTKLDVVGVITSTGGNSNNWNTAYSWGNHATMGYLTAETDPTVAASVKDGVSWGEVSGIPAGFADGIDDVGAGDNLGNHTATQNIKLSGYWLSGDGGNEGVYVANDGNVGIGTSSPAAKLSVNGDINAASVYRISGNTVLSVYGYNTFVGLGAGAVNTGWYNTFSGNNSGYSNTTGSDNTFSGNWSGNYNTTGYNNTFSGSSAGLHNTTGYNNTFSGGGAGLYNTTGNWNTFSGYCAGSSNTTGNSNTFLGYSAGRQNTTGSGDVFIGYNAGYYETGSNKLYVANSSGTPLIYGDFSTGGVGINIATAGGFTLFVNGPAYSTGGWLSSDLRFKKNIEKIDSPIDKVMNIKGVSFEWKTSEYKDKRFPEGRHYGVIAQEVEQILPEIVKEGPDGEKAVSYTEIVPVLAEAIKEQQKQIESLRSEVKALKEAMRQNQFTNAKEVQQ